MIFWEKLKRVIRILRIRWCAVRRENKVRILLIAISISAGVFIGNSVGHHAGEREGYEVAQKELEAVKQNSENEVETLKREKEQLEQQLSDIAEAPKLKDLPWNLTLVNWEHEMKQGYMPNLQEVEEGYYVDERIVEPLKQMLAAAEKDGMNIVICSAYRSVERQETLFNESLQRRLNKGMTYWEAYENNLLSVAAPGKSEHALGLAVDLVSSQYTKLNRKQCKTPEAKWLEEHCHEYGFILRYPPEKKRETKIIYEPWHYRYVGVEDATKIMEAGITLETYLQDYE